MKSAFILLFSIVATLACTSRKTTEHKYDATNEVSEPINYSYPIAITNMSRDSSEWIESAKRALDYSIAMKVKDHNFIYLIDEPDSLCYHEDLFSWQVERKSPDTIRLGNLTVIVITNTQQKE